MAADGQKLAPAGAARCEDVAYLEQHGQDRLIRPESEHAGPTPKRRTPLAER